MAKKIHKIEMLSGTFYRCYQTGLDGVSVITDKTIETTNESTGWTQSIDFIYDITNTEGKVITEIINIPVIVTYED